MGCFLFVQLSISGNRLEVESVEIKWAGGGRMSAMEVSDSVGCVLQITCRFPCAFMWFRVSFPLYEVFESSSTKFRVQYLLYFILGFLVDKNRWGGRRLFLGFEVRGGVWGE